METNTHNKLSLFVEDLQEATLAPQPLKEAAKQYLLGQDLPTTKSERFKYTRLAKLANANFTDPSKSSNSVEKRSAPIEDAYLLLIENEEIILPQDLPTGVDICLIKDTPIVWHEAAFKDVFSALNTLYAQTGLSICIGRNTVLDKPLQIVHTHNGGKQFFRHHLQFEQNSEAQIYFISESMEGSVSFAHTHIQYDIAKDARIKIFKIQDTASGHFHFTEDRAKQAEGSHFQINTLTLDGSFVRNESQVQIQGEHAQTYLNGAYWLKDDQHLANYTTIDHQVPNCESFETYKGVAADKAVGVFNGKVFVRKDAQKTNAYQSNANVLLSEDASINSKPELEIYADDVKCSHGSTTGQLDENALFYLRARGLSESAAKNLLLQAFMEDVLTYIPNEDLLKFIHHRIGQRFNWVY